MAREIPLFEAWCVPGWPGIGEQVAIRVLPPARAATDRVPELALAVPELRAGHVARLADTLREVREDLLERPVLDIARALGRVGERLLEPGDPLREEALAAMPGTAGLSPEMSRAVLDGMARDWTPGRLEALLRADVGDPAVLDRFVAGSRGVRIRAMGDPLAFHVCSGSVPGVSATSLVRSLLVKTPVVLKPGRGDVVLGVLLLRGLAMEDPGLARAAAVLYWPGGADEAREVEDELLARVGLVVAYGGDGLVGDLRARMPPTARLVEYRHRLSFAMVGREALAPDVLEGTAAAAARAVALFDQRGCVSPHAVFAEGRAAASELAGALADALEALDAELPPGRMDEAEASALHQLRGSAELRAASGEGVSVRMGGASPWTVVVEPGSPLVPSCLNRVVRVVPVDDLADVPRRVERLSRHLQSVGVAGVGADRMEGLAEELARLGVLRLTTLEGMPFPPAWWRHDGRGPLEALLRWVELEEG